MANGAISTLVSATTPQRATPFVLTVTTAARTIVLDPSRVYTFVNLGIDGTAGWATASTGVVFATFGQSPVTAPAAPVASIASLDDNNLMILKVGAALAVGPGHHYVYIDSTATVLVQVIPTESYLEHAQ